MRNRAWLPTAMLVVGGVLLCLGLAVIVLGWYGAAHTPYLFEQNSYLISGGLFGLGMVFTGGFVFFGAWLARMAAESRDGTRRLARALDALVSQREAASWPLVATARGSMLHTARCPLVGGREDLRTVAADEVDGLRPCGVCRPPTA